MPVHPRSGVRLPIRVGIEVLEHRAVDRPLRSPLLLPPLVPPGSGVGVPQIEPARPIVAEHPLHLPEHLDHRGDVGFGGRLEAELTVRAVVAEPPVGRARHDAVDALVPERDRPRVAPQEEGHFGSRSYFRIHRCRSIMKITNWITAPERKPSQNQSQGFTSPRAPSRRGPRSLRPHCRVPRGSPGGLRPGLLHGRGSRRLHPRGVGGLPSQPPSPPLGRRGRPSRRRPRSSACPTRSRGSMPPPTIGRCPRGSSRLLAEEASIPPVAAESLPESRVHVLGEFVLEVEQERKKGLVSGDARLLTFNLLRQEGDGGQATGHFSHHASLSISIATSRHTPRDLASLSYLSRASPRLEQ